MVRVTRTAVSAVVIAVAVALGGAEAARADSACTKTWDGPASGGDWDIATNWSPDGALGEDDVVCIGAGISTDQDSTITVAAVRAQGTVRSSSQLTIDAETPAGAESSTIATFVKSSHLTSEGALELGTWIWGGGLLGGAGTTTVKGNWESLGNFTFPHITSPHTLITEGTSVSTANGLSVAGAARWINRGAFSTTGGSFGGPAVNGSFPRFINEATGTVTKTAAAGNLSFSFRTENDGVMRRESGTGRFFVEADPNAVSDGTFTDMTLSDNGGFIRVGSGARLTKIVNGGHLRIPEYETFVVTDYTTSGGSLGGRGARLVLAGHTTAYYGRIGLGPDSAGDDRVALITHPAGATMTWTHATGFFASRFETDGEILIEETGLGRPQTTLGTGMLWVNTGTITMLAGLLPGADERQRLLNRGRIVKVTQSDATPGTMSITLRLINDGLLEIERGTVAASNFEQTSDGVLRFHLRGTTASSQHGLLSSTRLRHSGRIESVLGESSAGVQYAPAPLSRHNVISAIGAARSGAFLSNGLAGGMTLDEAAASNIALVMPAAVVIRGAQEAPVPSSAGAIGGNRGSADARALAALKERRRARAQRRAAARQAAAALRAASSARAGTARRGAAR